jgi:hypothetical protein
VALISATAALPLGPKGNKGKLPGGNQGAGQGKRLLLAEQDMGAATSDWTFRRGLLAVGQDHTYSIKLICNGSAQSR